MCLKIDFWPTQVTLTRRVVIGFHFKFYLPFQIFTKVTCLVYPKSPHTTPLGENEAPTIVYLLYFLSVATQTYNIYSLFNLNFATPVPTDLFLLEFMAYFNLSYVVILKSVV